MRWFRQLENQGLFIERDKGFIPLDPENPVFQSQKRRHIKFEHTRKPKVKTPGLTGVTLLEILVTVAISVFIIAGIFMVLNVADMTWYSDMGLLDLQQQARLAMDGMTREIRKARSEDINITDTSRNIQFRIPTNIATSPITYSDNITYYLNNNQIIRAHPAGTTKVLANDITSLNFSLSGNLLNIALRAEKSVRQRNLSFSLTEKVRLRNE